MSTKVLFRRLISIASPPSLPSYPPSTPQIPPLPAHRQHLPQPHLAPIPQTAPTPSLPTPTSHTTDYTYPSPSYPHRPLHRQRLRQPNLALAPIPQTAPTPTLPSSHRSSHREHATATESSHLIRSIYVQPSHTLLLDLLHLLDLLVLLARPISPISRVRSEARYTPLGAGIPRPISSPQIGDEKRSR